MFSCRTIFSMFLVLALTMVTEQVVAEQTDIAAPVLKLMAPEGEVEYSLDGTAWRDAPRIKYLFDGYMVRTGKGSSARLVNQESGTIQTLAAESKVEIMDRGVVVHQGSLSKPRNDDTSIWQSILKKFSVAQKYTTVRRAPGGCDPKVLTASTLTVSSAYPDLVWRNACPEYRYRLLIQPAPQRKTARNNGMTNPEPVVVTIEIPPQATSEMIRYSLADLKPATYQYRVQVLDNDGVIFSPRNGSEVTVLDDGLEAELGEALASAEGDILMQTQILVDRGLLVASMDLLRAYFDEFPRENDLRPLLAEAYARLRLESLRQAESRLYFALMAEQEQ